MDERLRKVLPSEKWWDWETLAVVLLVVSTLLGKYFVVTDQAEEWEPLIVRLYPEAAQQQCNNSTTKNVQSQLSDYLAAVAWRGAMFGFLFHPWQNDEISHSILLGSVEFSSQFRTRRKRHLPSK